MEKTAIKIPGKRTLDQSKAAIAARKALNRPRGRPLIPRTTKHVIKVVAPPNVKKRKKRSLKNIKSKRKMSVLEKLPVELLELVFGFCWNVELPRASPVIGGKLSSETVYIRAIFKAFGLHWSHSLKAFEEALPDYSDLQSSILRCRWANVNLMLKAQDLWLRKNNLNIMNPVYFIPKRPVPEEEDTSTDEMDTDDSESEGCPVKAKIQRPEITAVSHFEQDFTDFSTFVMSEVASDPLIPSWGSLFLLADKVEISHSLLSRPSWDEASIRYLFWIVKAGARVNWVTSTSGEIALLGQKNAISVGNLRVIYLLQWAGLYEKIDAELLIWALQNAGGDKLAVIELLISLGRSRFRILNSADAYEFHNAVYLEQDKRAIDEEQRKFLEKLQVSAIVQSWE